MPPVNPSSPLAQAYGLPQYRVGFAPAFERVEALVPADALPVVERAAVEVFRRAGVDCPPDRALAMGQVLEALAADFLAGSALDVLAQQLRCGQ